MNAEPVGRPVVGHTRRRSTLRRRRGVVALTVTTLVAALSLVGLGPAQAGAGFASNFELDKNAADDAATTADDWDSVYQQISLDANATGDDDRCVALGADECAFTSDPRGQSIFATGGSKDDLDISSWRHSTGAVPPKNEISNAYAAKYTANGHQFLYFGADRYAVSGSADFGFWFFKNEVTQVADGTFSGAHVARSAGPDGILGNTDDVRGDVLILGTFTQGGATSNVRVFEWVGTGGNATSNGTVAGPTGDFGDCATAAADADGCGTVNNAIVPVAWPYEGKVGELNEIPVAGFVEGGIDLTAQGLDGCFSSYLAETRSSPSVDAQLKDFVLDRFESCGTTLVTTPSTDDGTAIGTGGVSIGTGSIQVRDSAALSVSGVTTWSGTLAFSLCKIDTGTCTTGGTSVGSVNVTQSTPQPILSPAATVTSVGRYCWRGDFTATTTGVPNASDSSLGECFVVNPVTPTISTSATATVALGQSIDDTATLGGTATQPGTPVINPTTTGAAAAGTITFRLYGPGDTTCSLTPVFTSDPVTVSGNGQYSAGGFTPTVAGTYRWVASYTGNAPNTDPVSGACNDANEASAVTPRQPTISTNATGQVSLGQAISDSATLSNTAPRGDGTAAQGTITFTVYGPDDATCSGAAAFTGTASVSGDGIYSSGSFTPTAAGTYRWVASYGGDLPNTLAVSGACNDANEASVVISLQPTIGTVQSFVPNDAATVSVAEGGGALAGDVVFRMWVDDSTCSGDADYTSATLPISGGSGTDLSRTVTSANTTAYGTTGTTFHWTVTFTSTNLAHEDVASGCGVEHSSITVQNSGTAN